MNKMIRRSVAATVSLALLSLLIVSALSITAYGYEYNQSSSLNSDGASSTPVTFELADSYEKYLATYSDASTPDKEIIIPATAYSFCSYNPEIMVDYMGKAGTSVLTAEEGTIEWTVDIDEPGFYNISVDYYPIAGKSSEISRSIKIDGKLPFEEARNITFYRIWQNVIGKNGKAIQQDKRNNDIRPTQQESPMWITKPIKDSTGYILSPLKFYFSKGSHTIELISIKEPMLINCIRLYNEKPIPSYSDVKTEYSKKNYTPADSEIIKIQAEEPKRQSDPVISAKADRSTPAIEPNDPVYLRLNVLGAESWQQNGQWVTWEFNIEKNGLYNIGIKAIQNTIGGSFSSRRIYIDRKVPFKELDSVTFNYSSDWNVYLLGGNDNPYSFYFNKGKHEITIEVTLGEMASILKRVSDITNKLNTIYRKILVVTGPNPDIERDYEFEKIMPDVISDLKTQSDRLIEVYNDIVTKTGMDGENAQILRKVHLQTADMVKNPDTIADRFIAFQQNISSIGTWVALTKNQPLTLDYIYIAPENSEVPNVKAPFWERLKFVLYSFFASFSQDYNNISDVDSKDAIKVWIGTGGRDQAQLLKTMIDNSFTNDNNIPVELQLVPMGALLPATLANIGPDVALTVGMSDPVNYACRHAVINLADFPDYPEIAKRFSPSSIVPLQFEEGVYGLPETVTYFMLFYRKDILQELNLSIPNTWDDVLEMLPVLQKKQMNFALPPAAGPTGMSMSAFATLLYQNGGELYSSDNKKSALDSRISIDAFSFLTSLYIDYNIPVVVDFANRFRTGDTPIGISDFSLYNQLSVFAPELEGVWDFAEIPGIKRKDGTINRSTPNNITACIILSKSKRENEAWEFIKWWTSAQTQQRFGREIEFLLGTSARYATANLEAQYQIPWSKAAYNKLVSQSQSVIGIPQIPGGYYTPRYLDFAFRDVINNNADPGASLEKAAEAINSEIETKRREFGLTN